MFQGSDPYDGALSMHLKSTQIIIFGFPVSGPGIATNGIISLVGTNFQFSGGSPDTARSRYFTGYYKYSPKNATDAAIVNVTLFRNVTGTRDTVAVGTIMFTDTVDTYTNFIVQMHYRDWENRPDTSRQISAVFQPTPC